MTRRSFRFWDMTTQMALIFSGLSLVLGVALLIAMTSITKEQSVKRLAAELEGIVGTATPHLNGDQHKLFIDDVCTAKSPWQEARAYLEEIRAVNDLEPDHFYTFTLTEEKDKLAFAVMLHETPFVGDFYTIPEQNQPLIDSVLRDGKPRSSVIYEDEHGQWISAFSVIRDSQGAPAGLLQADHRVDQDNSAYKSALSADFGRVRMVFLLFLPLCFVLILLIARTIVRPIDQMAFLAQSTSEGNWAQPMPRMRWNELQALGNAFERMRHKIAEQIGELRNFNKELERQVDIKTRDLQEANADLKKAQTELERQAELRILYEKTHDELTGLGNRVQLMEEMTVAAARAQLGKRQFAVLVVGMDRFRQVNESMGTEAGDRVIKIMSEKIHRELGEADRLCRLDGDRFAAVINDIQSLDHLLRLALGIKDSISAPCEIGDLTFHLTASVGISVYPDDTTELTGLIKNAEAAMFSCKKEGGNRSCLYAANMDEEGRKRVALEADMRAALDKDEFTLFYQPQISLVTGRLVGVEALIRWIKADGTMVSPGAFIPLAEETGLIVPLGRWVIETAVAMARSWRDAGLPPLVVAINLSARQFKEEDLPLLMERILREKGVEPRFIELEITESVAMDDVKTTVKTLADLKDMGLNLAIDDFGTGYSSLSYLKQFALDKLKIDRSFVMHAPTNNEDAAIARAVINLGHSLGLKVIAEGIEEEAHLEFLKEHHCDEAQGYYYSKPVPLENLKAMLEEGRLIGQEIF